VKLCEIVVEVLFKLLQNEQTETDNWLIIDIEGLTLACHLVLL